MISRLHSRIQSLVGAFLEAVVASPGIYADEWLSMSYHIGALTLRKNELLRINTPTGYFGDGAMHYYAKDYQGNIRQVTDAELLQISTPTTTQTLKLTLN